MKFQPRPRFEALAAKAVFRGALEPEVSGGPEAPERLEHPGTAWRRLETPPHAWMKLNNLYRPTMAYNIYYVLFVGFAFWVHLTGICGGL